MHRDLYIIDNANQDKSVKRYLNEWCNISRQLDIATGYFEIGGLLELDGQWQKLDKIRILLGSEVTKRTQNIFNQAILDFIGEINDRLDKSIDNEKERNEFLLGIPAILKAIQQGKIECRVIDKSKFHAKAYITYLCDDYYSGFVPSMNIPKGYALVGSSNFTKPGLTGNIELNVQITSDVAQLQDWFEKHWENAEDISTAILTVIEKHCREYFPYDVYLKSMYEYFKGNNTSVTIWEETESSIFPLLSTYQQDGYNSLVKISEKYSGSFLCDGVGLGKTFVGMMLIERFVKKERKNVVLIVPASARISVWETTINKYIPEILDGFYTFKIINHTDLLLEKNKNLMDKIAEQAEYIIIDEAHHFRNRSSMRYKKLYDMMGQGRKKQIFMLTATPINNSFFDLKHLIELFTQRREDYFSMPPLGIHSLTGHFKKMEAKLNGYESNERDKNNEFIEETDRIFKGDALVTELVVQRSRSYVKKSLKTTENETVLFPNRKPPTVANYSLEKTYGRLIKDFIDSFYRKDKNSDKIVPILALPIYCPYTETYFIGDKSNIDEMKMGRQVQVVNLIRQLLLKRFESSAAAFEETCIRIFIRLQKFLKDYKEYGDIREIERFFQRKELIINYIEEYFRNSNYSTLEDIEDELPEYIWNIDDELSVEDFDIRIMLQDTIGDLEILSDFLKDLMEIDSDNDDKIRELKRILLEDSRVKNKKVIIFSEYRTTAKYIEKQLKKSGFNNVFEIDGQTKEVRHEIIKRFSPYYNDANSNSIKNEIQILIATDVLAEGLNLQDASCLINYELHWNPVRLMQRIGRVDRRRKLDIERQLIKDHPEIATDRANIYYWNFLPPKELENLLLLYKTVSQKTLRISKTFGIEGKQLLTPEDDYETLKEFNSAYDGKESKEEEIILEYQHLMKENPNYSEIVSLQPSKIFSGMKAGEFNGVFFCYELPTKCVDGSWANSGAGIFKWFFYDCLEENIVDDMYTIWKIIRCNRDQRRYLNISENDFGNIKKKIDRYINQNYMRSIQAPVGIKPRIVSWMQVK